MARPPAIVLLVTTGLNMYARLVLKQLKQENLKLIEFCDARENCVGVANLVSFKEKPRII